MRLFKGSEYVFDEPAFSKRKMIGLTAEQQDLLDRRQVTSETVGQAPLYVGFFEKTAIKLTPTAVLRGINEIVLAHGKIEQVTKINFGGSSEEALLVIASFVGSKKK